MSNVKVTNIEWDTDDENIESLPTEVEIRVGLTGDDESSEGNIADELGNMFGWCVFSFSWEVL